MMCQEHVNIFPDNPYWFSGKFTKLDNPASFKHFSSLFYHQKFTPMVTTDVAQLAGECNAWRDALRSRRNEFTYLKARLQEVAGRQTHRDILLEVEHLYNQFHIQLINIHDLKQAIKTHERRVRMENTSPEGQVTDETLAEHENLFDSFQHLEHTLREVSDEFDQFVAAVR